MLFQVVGDFGHGGGPEISPRTDCAEDFVNRGEDPIPVGILYQNPEVPCYEDLRGAGRPRSSESIRKGLEAEFDKFTVWPQAADPALPSSPV